MIAFIRARGRRRALVVCYLGFAALSFGLSETIARYFHHAQTSASAWLVWAYQRLKGRVTKNPSFSLRALLLFIGLGPLWMFLIPAAINNVPFRTEILLFPSFINTVPDPCDVLPIGEFIDKHYKKETLLIVPYWQSSEFLYYTNLKIDFLANYPSQDKFIDNYNFWGTHSVPMAADIAERHGIDLVAVCQIPYLYRNGLPETMQSFLGQLQVGHAPSWLKRVNTGDLDTRFFLYEVDKTAFKIKGAQ
jgi:hypothetical protein